MNVDYLSNYVNCMPYYFPPQPELVHTAEVMDLLNFIITYFVTKDLYMMSAFICWPPEQISRMWRSARVRGVRLSVFTDLRRPPNMPPYDRHREAMLVDLQCPHVHFLLQHASYSRAFNYRHAWLLLDNSPYNRSKIEQTLEDYIILPDSDVVWSSPDSTVDVYRVKEKQPYLLTDLGLSQNASRTEVEALFSALPRTVTRRKDLRNVKIVGCSVIGQPAYFQGWSDLSNRQIDTFPKFTYPLLLNLADDLNFHLAFRQVDFYGVVQPNGSFNGLVGLLERHEVEVGSVSIFMRHDRMNVVHFFSETLALTTAFIFRQPSRSAVSNVFLAPFSSGVWLACGLVAWSAAVLLVILKRLREMVHQRSRQLLAPLTLPDTFTFALGSMCQQGFYITPAVTSVRLVMFSTMLSSLFVFTAYSAKIVTLLQTPSDAVRTLDDLTKSPMMLGIQETTYKKVYFLEAVDAATQRLYHRKILPQGERAYLQIDEGIAKVRTGLFAFQVERSSGYDVITKTFTEREKCSLDEIEAFKMPMVSIPMRKFSGYRELFAVRMRWQREAGLMSRAQRVWMTSRPRCEVASGGFVSIGLSDVLPAIQTLGLGALLAVGLLVAELIIHTGKKKAIKCCKRRAENKQNRILRRWQ